MKKPITYLFSVLLTLLLIFSLIGLTLCGLIRFRALDPDTFTLVVNEQALPIHVQDELQIYFSEQENATGIPAYVYAEPVEATQLRPIILERVRVAFDYLNGKTDSLAVSPDFSMLEQSLTAFFEQYAEENNYQKDALYDETVANAIESAKTNISSACDVFRIELLDKAGLLKKVRRYMPLLNPALIGCACAAILALILLAVVNRKEKGQIFYWLGTGVLVASLLMLAPAVYLQATRWFDRFAVKSGQVFAAVTGYLYKMTGTVITAAVIGIVIALCCYLLRGVIGGRGRRTAD